jgi:endogenous inhibitor of DNA gyrase (YacG/DUF329 family)
MSPSSPSEPQKVRVSAAACLVCGKPVDARYRPFCSKRCSDIDLGRWLGESYRVPTEEIPGPDGTPWKPEDEL